MKFLYLRDCDKHPIACIASEKRDDGFIHFAVSTWNPCDAFDREMARVIAAGRLVLNVLYSRGAVRASHFDDMRAANMDENRRIMMMIVNSRHSFPQRTRQAAMQWNIDDVDRRMMRAYVAGANATSTLVDDIKE